MRYFFNGNVLRYLAIRFVAAVGLPLLLAVTAALTTRSLGWPVLPCYALALLVAFLAFSLSVERTDGNAEPTDLKRYLPLLLASFLLPALAMAATSRLLALSHLPLWGAYPASGAVGVLAFCAVTARLFPAPEKPTNVRGRTLIAFAEAQRKALKLLPKGAMGMLWGGLTLPLERATGHSLVVGNTGSGKTLTIRLYEQSVLPTIVPGSDRRALGYDAKGNELSMLHGMDLSCPIVTLNPFDKRGARWDISLDVTSPASAWAVASLLIPQDKNASQPFFVQAAQHLLYGVLLALIQTAGEDWTFADVVRALQSREHIEALLARTPDTQAILEQYFAIPERVMDIQATIATKMAPFTIIAALWERASETVSLREWVEGESILILGNNEACKSALGAINRVLFQRISELILSQPDSDTRRTYIILDEVREAGCLEGLSSLMVKSRSKGAAITLGFQDLQGMYEAYGERAANEITGQASHIAVLRLASPATAKWASDLFGPHEKVEMRASENESNGAHGSSKGSAKSEHLVKREAILFSQFLEIAPTNPKNGLTGFYIVPGIGAYRAHLEGKWLGERLKQPNPDVPDFLPREEAEQYLPAWTEADLQRLGLQPQPVAEPPANPPDADPPVNLPVAVSNPAVVPPKASPIAANPPVTLASLRGFGA